MNTIDTITFRRDRRYYFTITADSLIIHTVLTKEA